MANEPSRDRNALKATGIIQQKGGELYCLRLRVVGGEVNAERLEALARLSVKYGSGHVHLTARQGLEIPNVPWEQVEALRAELGQVGLEFGGCGKRVRTITACQGGLCVHGLIDPQDLARRIDALPCVREALPHKFKIGLTGCPNGCLKPRENDIGVGGEALPEFVEDLCTACGQCVEVCPAPGALRVEADRLLYDASRCLGCGKCVAACPTGAWQAAGVRYAVWVGGKMGKFPRLAERLSVEIADEAQLLSLIESLLDWYAEHGAVGERFGDTLDRLGAQALAPICAAHSGPANEA